MVNEAWLAQLQQDIAGMSPFDGGAGSAPVLVPGERRDVVTLFLDLEGFTSMSEDLDHETVHSLVTGVMSVLSGIVENNGGTIDKFEGDRLMALFGAVAASEDDCSRAALGALSMMSAVREIASALEQKGLHLDARIGMSFGSVTVAPDASGHLTVTGDEVNVASRLEQAAEPGTIMATGRLAGQCAGQFAWDDLGETILRGRSKPVAVFRLAGLAPDAASRLRFHDAGLALRGRRDEMDKAARFLREELDPPIGPDGTVRHRLLLVTGEEGAGKSRFVEEVLSTAAGGSGSEILGIDASKPDWMLTLVRGRRAGTDPEGSGQGRDELDLRIALRDRVQETASGCIRLFIVVDNAHRMSDQARETLEFVLKTARTERSLDVVVMSRKARGKGFAPPAVHDNHAGLLEIELGPLTGSDTACLLASYLDVDDPEDLPVGLASFVHARSGGNPRFALELAADLAGAGTLRKTSSGWFFPSRNPGCGIPSSLSGLVRARLDRMPERHRRAMQIASLLGEEFPLPLFEDVAKRLGQADLAGMLSEMEFSGALEVREGWVRLSDRLLASAAGDSTLRMNRQLIHSTAADSLLAMDTGIQRPAELVALHLFESGRTAEAVPWALEAAKEARSNLMNDRASAWALRIHRECRDHGAMAGRDGILLALGGLLQGIVYEMLPGEGIEEALEDALRAAVALGERCAAAGLMLSLAEVRRRSGDIAAASALVRESLDMSRSGGFASGELEALSALGNLCMHRGDLVEAVEYYEQASMLRDASTDDPQRADVADINHASALLMLGRLEEADAMLTGLLSRPDRCRSLKSRIRALTRLGVLRGRQERFGESMDLLEEVAELARRTGDMSSLSMALGNLGVTASRLGDDRSAIRYHRRALAVSREIENLRSMALCLYNLASLLAVRGDIGQAEPLALEAAEVIGRSGSRVNEGTIQAMLGWIRFSRGDASAAERHYGSALETLAVPGAHDPSASWLRRLYDALAGTGAGIQAPPDGFKCRE